jgi:hypothetical protein
MHVQLRVLVLVCSVWCVCGMLPCHIAGSHWEPRHIQIGRITRVQLETCGVCRGGNSAVCPLVGATGMQVACPGAGDCTLLRPNYDQGTDGLVVTTPLGIPLSPCVAFARVAAMCSYYISVRAEVALGVAPMTANFTLNGVPLGSPPRLIDYDAMLVRWDVATALRLTVVPHPLKFHVTGALLDELLTQASPRFCCPRSMAASGGAVVVLDPRYFAVGDSTSVACQFVALAAVNEGAQATCRYTIDMSAWSPDLDESTPHEVTLHMELYRTSPDSSASSASYSKWLRRESSTFTRSVRVLPSNLAAHASDWGARSAAQTICAADRCTVQTMTTISSPRSAPAADALHQIGVFRLGGGAAFELNGTLLAPPVTYAATSNSLYVSTVVRFGYSIVDVAARTATAGFLLVPSDATFYSSYWDYGHTLQQWRPADALAPSSRTTITFFDVSTGPATAAVAANDSRVVEFTVPLALSLSSETPTAALLYPVLRIADAGNSRTSFRLQLPHPAATVSYANGVYTGSLNMTVLLHDRTHGAAYGVVLGPGRAYVITLFSPLFQNHSTLGPVWHTATACRSELGVSLPVAPAYPALAVQCGGDGVAVDRFAPSLVACTLTGNASLLEASRPFDVWAGTSIGRRLLGSGSMQCGRVYPLSASSAEQRCMGTLEWVNVTAADTHLELAIRGGSVAGTRRLLETDTPPAIPFVLSDMPPLAAHTTRVVPAVVTVPVAASRTFTVQFPVGLSTHVPTAPTHPPPVKLTVTFQPLRKTYLLEFTSSVEVSDTQGLYTVTFSATAAQLNSSKSIHVLVTPAVWTGSAWTFSTGSTWSPQETRVALAHVPMATPTPPETTAEATHGSAAFIWVGGIVALGVPMGVFLFVLLLLKN